MKSAIYIPKKINVGYRERQDTYTGKLAYVIYWDEKGVLRKEKSWNGWRDENIPNDEFENIPTEGFVLNKHTGGVENSWGWNARKSYCRIYDPRGFEFEITIENLLYILENTSCIKGKGVECEGARKTRERAEGSRILVHRLMKEDLLILRGNVMLARFLMT